MSAIMEKQYSSKALFWEAVKTAARQQESYQNQSMKTECRGDRINM